MIESAVMSCRLGVAIRHDTRGILYTYRDGLRSETVARALQDNVSARDFMERRYVAMGDWRSMGYSDWEPLLPKTAIDLLGDIAR